MCHRKCQVLWAFCESQFNVNFQNEIKERERERERDMIGRANDMGSAAPPVHRGDWGSSFFAVLLLRFMVSVGAAYSTAIIERDQGLCNLLQGLSGYESIMCVCPQN